MKGKDNYEESEEVEDKDSRYYSVETLLDNCNVSVTPL
jgi:hypothetical protein